MSLFAKCLAGARYRKTLTLVVVLQEESRRVLLGYKKRGFGADRFNGFGGKVEAGETVLEAAHRELQEEAGITADDMAPAGNILFEFEGDDEILDVRVYRTTSFRGEVTERCVSGGWGMDGGGVVRR